MITQKLVLNLIDAAKEKGDTNRVQSYWNAYHCQTQITSDGKNIYGQYCKTRFCMICLGIRKAEILNTYLPVISQWDDPRFVTLTATAVKAERLNYWMHCFPIAFRRTYERLKKRHQRGKGIKIMGIKSLECNYNPVAKTYNPHYHLIVPNAEVSNILVVEWQRTWNTKQKLARPFAQDSKKINNNKQCLIEVVKYGAKVFTDPEMKKRGKSTIPPIIYAAAMDNIFAAMNRKRLFDRFGFNLPKKERGNKATQKVLTQYEDWAYENAICDWVNPDTGEILTGYTPTSQLQWLLKHNIDRDSV